MKLVTVIVEPLAIRIPPADTTTAALMARFEPDVSNVVVLMLSWIVSVPPTSIRRVDIVKV